MAIIQNIDQVKLFVPVNQNVNMRTLNPSIETATLELIDLMSKSDYDLMHSAFTNNDYTSMEWFQRILPFAQGFIATRAVYLSGAFMRTNISELGMQQSYTDSGNMSRPAAKEDVRWIKSSLAKLVSNFVERLLAQMETEVKATDMALVGWQSSPSFTLRYQLLLSSATEFAQIIPQAGSRKLFNAISARILSVQKQVLRPITCKALYDDLLKYKKAVSLNQTVVLDEYSTEIKDQYNALLELVYPALAYNSLDWGLPYLNVFLDDDGLFLSEYGLKETRDVASDLKKIEALRFQLKSDASTAWEDVRQYLGDNYEAIPLYAESTCCEKSQYKPDSLPENDGRVDFWFS